MSPRLSVPDCTSSVATGPRPLSRRASMTTPLAGASTGAFSSSTSACSRICSSSASMPCAGLGRHRHDRRLAAEVFRHHAVREQVLLDPLRIGFVLVDLVDRHHQRHVGRLGMRDRLDGLRHDAVVGRHHQHHDVGDLGAARAHRGECLMARRIEEGDHAARRLHVIGADVLRDAARLAGGDLGACGCSRAARSCRGRRGPSR